MNEDTCPLVLAKTPLVEKNNWQTILIIVGLILLFLILFYFFYKFISHTNQKFKIVEQAINQMNERMKQPPQIEIKNPFQNLFQPAHHQPPIQVHQPQVIQQPPIQVHQPQVIPQPPIQVKQTPQQQPVVIDARVLDKELSEELKELDAAVDKQEEPEGRVDTIPEVVEE